MLKSSRLLRIVKTLNKTPIALIVFATLLNVMVVIIDLSPKWVEPEPQDQRNEERRNAEYHETEQTGFWPFAFSHISDFSTVFIAIFNGLLVYVTYRLVSTTNKLWGAGEKQLVEFNRLAMATELSANAALASLDRPWLFIERLAHNERDWKDGKAELIAEFRIVNHGRVPAVIMEIKAIFFRSPGRFGDKDFPIQKLPDNIIRFPDPEQLNQFIHIRGQSPFIDISGLPNLSGQVIQLQPFNFDNPVVPQQIDRYLYFSQQLEIADTSRFYANRSGN